MECLCLGTIGLIVAPWKFDILKPSIFALLHFSGKYLFQEHQISVGQLSADSSSTETLWCLNTPFCSSVKCNLASVWK